MGAQRDPVSVWFDQAARQLLERAYRNQGEWTGQYLAPPSARARARLALMGVSPAARDRWGEVRWVRAYKRAVYYQLKKHGFRDQMRYGGERTSPWPARSLEWQTGARVRKAGWPSARWAIRIRIHPTGAAASRAAREKTPQRERWVINGRVTPRQSTPADRGGYTY
jgi:hypothetical protein